MRTEFILAWINIYVWLKCIGEAIGKFECRNGRKVGNLREPLSEEGTP